MGSDGWSRGCTDVDAVQTDGVAVTMAKSAGLPVAGYAPS